VCLAKAYLNKWGGEPVFEDISHMRLRGKRVELEALLGEEKVIPGRVVEVDFAASRILLDEHREPDRSSSRRRNVVN
jgi:predicted RNA-binding protein